jgi:hypothetical protein
MRRIFDWVAVSYIRRRLAAFRKRGDFADKFGDRLVALLAAEIERRNRLIDGWDAENRREASEQARRQAVIEQFESFKPSDGLRLQ